MVEHRNQPQQAESPLGYTKGNLYLSGECVSRPTARTVCEEDTGSSGEAAGMPEKGESEAHLQLEELLAVSAARVAG